MLSEVTFEGFVIGSLLFLQNLLMSSFFHPKHDRNYKCPNTISQITVSFRFQSILKKDIFYFRII